jgi:hypothetical protein
MQLWSGQQNTLRSGHDQDKEVVARERGGAECRVAMAEVLQKVGLGLRAGLRHLLADLLWFPIGPIIAEIRSRCSASCCPTGPTIVPLAREAAEPLSLFRIFMVCPHGESLWQSSTPLISLFLFVLAREGIPEESKGREPHDRGLGAGSHSSVPRNTPINKRGTLFLCWPDLKTLCFIAFS